MSYYIIGTAGHVDHGKSMLIKALTGEDTDRLKEEKERGISIELGFASLTLPSGAQAGVVDVPGHERFVRQMLAGIGGIDLVLLVIAADEGVMPQTKEHLEIIDLLQIKKGIVLLNKIDLVDPDWGELVKMEVEEALKDTVLEGAAILEVSALTGQGLSQLTALLDQELEKLSPKEAFGPCRMPIDRVFIIPGFGTVVTGTVYRGSIRKGESVVVEPGGLESRIRSVQVHGSKVEAAVAGQRVAVNLPDLEVMDIPRGANLLTPNQLTPVQTLDISLRYLLSAGNSLQHHQRVRFHIGTKEAFGRIHLLDRDEVEPGSNAFAQILLEEPVIAARGDKYVIRRYSPAHTIAGGIVLDCSQRKYKRFDPAVLAQLEVKERGTPQDLVLARLQSATLPLGINEIAKLTGLSSEVTEQAVASLGSRLHFIVSEGQKYWFSQVSVDRWTGAMKEGLKDFQKRYFLRLGLPKEECKSKFFSRWNTKLFSAFLNSLQQDGILVIMDNFVSLPGYQPGPQGILANTVKGISEHFRKSGLTPPDWGAVAAENKLDNSLSEEVLQFLLREGELIKVAPNLYFSNAAVENVQEALCRLLNEKGEFSMVEVKEKLNISRKYLIPLLEYFDSKKLTRRVGELRVKF